MRSNRWIRTGTTVAIVTLTLVIGGCAKEEAPSPQGAGEVPAATEQPKTPLIPKREVADWCREHGVPESVCTLCNDSLVAEFKEKGDWCKEHNLPDSQCVTCHPELEAKFKAMAPKSEEEK